MGHAQGRALLIALGKLAVRSALTMMQACQLRKRHLVLGVIEAIAHGLVVLSNTRQHLFFGEGHITTAIHPHIKGIVEQGGDRVGRKAVMDMAVEHDAIAVMGAIPKQYWVVAEYGGMGARL